MKCSDCNYDRYVLQRSQKLVSMHAAAFCLISLIWVCHAGWRASGLHTHQGPLVLTDSF